MRSVLSVAFGECTWISPHTEKYSDVTSPCPDVSIFFSFPVGLLGQGLSFSCVCAASRKARPRAVAGAAVRCRSADSDHYRCLSLLILITRYPCSSAQAGPGWMCNRPRFKVFINPKSIILTLFTKLELLSFLPFLHPGSCFCPEMQWGVFQACLIKAVTRNFMLHQLPFLLIVFNIESCLWLLSLLCLAVSTCWLF